MITPAGFPLGEAIDRSAHRAAVSLGELPLVVLSAEWWVDHTRLGWEHWQGALAGRSEHGLVPTPEQRGVMILRLNRTPLLNLDCALTIECQGGRLW